jgi:hypothetical protein
MGSAVLVAASMLRGRFETLGAVRTLRPAVSRDAADTRKPQAGNSFHRFAISARSPDATTGDASFGRRDGRAPQLSSDAL